MSLHSGVDDLERSHGEIRLAQEKIRVYVLARELDMETKDLLDLCQQAQIDVRNQLSSLDPEQRDVVVEMVRARKARPAAGGKAPAAGPLAPPAARVPTLAPSKPPVLPSRPAAPTP